MKKLLSLSLLLIYLLAALPIHAQTTARGAITAYNPNNGSVTVNLNESDFRFNMIDLSGGLVAVTINGITREAYMIPLEKDVPDLDTVVRLMGFDPGSQSNPLALFVARSASALRHFDPSVNPLVTFNAQVGDGVRVDAIAGLPAPIQRDVETNVTALRPSGDLQLALTHYEADTAGLFPPMTGTVTIGGYSATFTMIDQQNYYDENLSTELALYIDPEAAEAERLLLLPAPGSRTSLNIAQRAGATDGTPVRLSWQGFDYGDTSAGQITALDGNTLQTNIPGSYLDQLAVPNGGYMLIIINGIIRAAMVMDDALFAASQERYGLSSNYILHRPAVGNLRLIYTVADGRTAPGIFAAEIGSRVRMRPARSIESIVRAEVVVKTIAEIDPSGYFYTDITPYELSFLEVLVGEYVNLQVNGITYRSRVVDESLLNEVSEGDILLYPLNDVLLVTHTVGNSVTAEARFQAFVGDPVIIERAPN